MTNKPSSGPSEGGFSGSFLQWIQRLGIGTLLTAAACNPGQQSPDIEAQVVKDPKIIAANKAAATEALKKWALLHGAQISVVSVFTHNDSKFWNYLDYINATRGDSFGFISPKAVYTVAIIKMTWGDGRGDGMTAIALNANNEVIARSLFPL